MRNDLVTLSNGNPIIWNGHACEGADLTPHSKARNFCLWTRCGQHDVPANAAREGSEQEITCDDCNSAIAKAEEVREWLKEQ